MKKIDRKKLNTTIVWLLLSALATCISSFGQSSVFFYLAASILVVFMIRYYKLTRCPYCGFRLLIPWNADSMDGVYCGRCGRKIEFEG